jgi:hypothetical protein
MPSINPDKADIPITVAGVGSRQDFQQEFLAGASSG